MEEKLNKDVKLTDQAIIWWKEEIMKKFMSALLALTLVLGMGTSVFAETQEQPIVSIGQSVEMKIIDDYTMQFTEKGVVETVQVLGNQVVISNQNTGDKIVLTINGNSIHSSATDKTITLTDSEVDAISTFASHPQTKTKLFSYASIKSALGGTATVAGVAGMIVAGLVAAGITVPTALPTVITFLGGITGLVSQVMKGSSSHGIKVNLKEVKRIAHRQGKEYIVWVWSISSIGTY